MTYDYDNGGILPVGPTFVTNRTDSAIEILNVQKALDYIQEHYGSISNIQTAEEDETEA